MAGELSHSSYGSLIPVAGKELWQLDPHHVLLTDELLRDSAEYRARITPVVQALL